MSESQPNRRANRLFGQRIAYSRFQLKFSLLVFILLALSVAITWLVAKTTITTLISDGYVTGDSAVAGLRMINVVIAQTSFLTLMVTFFIALFFSHYVAGPIYRFERVLEEMKEGNLNLHIRLRDKDEFKETAELFNDALHSLRQRVEKEREGMHGAMEKLRELAEDLKANGRKDEAIQLNNLIVEIQNLPPQLKI